MQNGGLRTSASGPLHAGGVYYCFPSSFFASSSAGGRPCGASPASELGAETLTSFPTEPFDWEGAEKVTSFDERREPVVRIEGWSFGFFEAGWLEGRRAQRHMYEVHWEPAAAPKARRSPRPVVLVSSPAVSTARYPTTDSQAAATVAAVAFDGASQRLSTLPSLQAALCLVQATDTARPLWLTSCAARGAEACVQRACAACVPAAYSYL